MDMAEISLERIVKRYGAVEAIHGVDLRIGDGEFVAFVGPSGCGKSTMLRMIAGLEDISGGRLSIADRVVNDVEPKGRDVAMVFQDYALYPHMSVEQNIGFGLKMRGEASDVIRKKVAEAARILQLEEFLDRRPAQLSGGQRQRVAMGRAIVRKPKVFLFDEPLSNLDAKLRVEMRTQIKRLHRMLRTTTIYVTHDQVEAMTLADRVVVLRKGNIIQHGRPLELYEQPNCRFVAEFIGSPQMNIIPGHLITSDRGVAVDFEGGTIALAHVAAGIGTKIDIGLRPEHLIPCYPEEADLFAEIDVLEELGSDTLAICLLGQREVTVRVPAERARDLRGRLALRFDRGNLHLFSAEDGRRLEFCIDPVKICSCYKE
jgi:multiple sugar transport system ATP-binding protein